MIRPEKATKLANGVVAETQRHWQRRTGEAVTQGDVVDWEKTYQRACQIEGVVSFQGSEQKRGRQQVESDLLGPALSGSFFQHQSNRLLETCDGCTRRLV